MGRYINVFYRFVECVIRLFVGGGRTDTVTNKRRQFSRWRQNHTTVYILKASLCWDIFICPLCRQLLLQSSLGRISHRDYYSRVRVVEMFITWNETKWLSAMRIWRLNNVGLAGKRPAVNVMIDCTWAGRSYRSSWAGRLTLRFAAQVIVSSDASVAT